MGDQSFFALDTDCDGGAIVTWDDRRGEFKNIYAQRLGSDGTPLWTIDGVPICTVLPGQAYPKIASDGEGGAIIVWEDWRNLWDDDIYAQHVDSEGEMWAATKLAARLDVTPEVLNLKSQGRWVICFIGLPEGYDAADIDIASIRLNDVVTAERYSWGMKDSGVSESRNLTVKFDRAEVARMLTPGEGVEISVTGVVGSEEFRGTDQIRVIDPPDSRIESAFPMPGPQIFSVEVHPNPFNPVCTISYCTRRSGRVRLAIYDITGSLVRTLVDAHRRPGSYSEHWGGMAEDGRELPSGVYFYRLEAGDIVASKKAVLLR
jgi:hypothetical protein